MNTTNVYNQAQQDLSAYFDKSAGVVTDYADQFETQYGRPAVDYAVRSFNNHPFITVFAVAFSILAFLPVLLFVGISLFLSGSILFIALAGAIISIFVVELSLLFGLTLALITVLFFSIPFAGFILSTYLAFRLILHVQANGGPLGISTWAAETKKHFLPTINMIIKVNGNTIAQHDSHSESDSVVVVQEKDRQSDWETTVENSPATGVIKMESDVES